MKDKNMIQGDLFDLKGKKRWKALRQRLLFVVTDKYIWFIGVLMIYGYFLLQIIIKQQGLLH